MQRSGGEETFTEVLGKSVDEKCCSELYRSVGEE